MHAELVALGLVWLAFAGAVQAQSGAQRIRGSWSIGLTVGTTSFGGATSATGPEADSVRFFPYRATAWGIGLSYGKENLRFGLAARYSQPGLGFRGVGEEAGLLIVASNAYRVATFAGMASLRLARLRGGADLRPSLGILMERWSAPGSAANTIVGVQGGLAVEVALTRAFVATLEGEVGATPGSPFRKEDLPEGFRGRSTWRRTLAGGLHWRF